MGVQPPAPALFDQLIQSFSLSQVTVANSLASASTFLQAKRREAVLSHFPAHIGQHFKSKLASSSFEGKFLFEEAVLSSVTSEAKDDQDWSTQVKMAKAFTLPAFGSVVLGKGKSAATPPPPAPNRGRGKGQQRGSWKRKRSPGPGRDFKSSRGGSSGASRGAGSSASGNPAPAGRGFQK